MTCGTKKTASNKNIRAHRLQQILPLHREAICRVKLHARKCCCRIQDTWGFCWARRGQIGSCPQQNGTDPWGNPAEPPKRESHAQGNFLQMCATLAYFNHSRLSSSGGKSLRSSRPMQCHFFIHIAYAEWENLLGKQPRDHNLWLYTRPRPKNLEPEALNSKRSLEPKTNPNQKS